MGHRKGSRKKTNKTCSPGELQKGKRYELRLLFELFCVWKGGGLMVFYAAIGRKGKIDNGKDAFKLPRQENNETTYSGKVGYRRFCNGHKRLLLNGSNLCRKDTLGTATGSVKRTPLKRKKSVTGNRKTGQT